MGRNRPIVAVQPPGKYTEYYGFRTYPEARAYIETHPEMKPRLVKIGPAPKEVDASAPRCFAETD